VFNACLAHVLTCLSSISFNNEYARAAGSKNLPTHDHMSTRYIPQEPVHQAFTQSPASDKYRIAASKLNRAFDSLPLHRHIFYGTCRNCHQMPSPARDSTCRATNCTTTTAQSLRFGPVYHAFSIFVGIPLKLVSAEHHCNACDLAPLRFPQTQANTSPEFVNHRESSVTPQCSWACSEALSGGCW
jgi:hypothetical protein